MQYNRGAAAFIDLFQYMDSIGFAMFDLIEFTRDYDFDVLTQFDILWVKKDSKFWDPECTGYPTPNYFNRNKNV